MPKTNFRKIATGGIALMLALSASSAFAHGKKEATLPADGAVLASTPQAVGMSFDQPMRVTMIKLLDENGAEHALVRSDNMAPVKEFMAVPAALPSGHFTIQWRGMSPDGHAMEGSFSFDIDG